MPPSVPDQNVYRLSGLIEKSTAWSLWNPPASVSASPRESPAGIRASSTKKAAIRMNYGLQRVRGGGNAAPRAI